jgi:hypothetical protein
MMYLGRCKSEGHEKSDEQHYRVHGRVIDVWCDGPSVEYNCWYFSGVNECLMLMESSRVELN